MSRAGGPSPAPEVADKSLDTHEETISFVTQVLYDVYESKFEDQSDFYHWANRVVSPENPHVTALLDFVEDFNVTNENRNLQIPRDILDIRHDAENEVLQIFLQEEEDSPDIEIDSTSDVYQAIFWEPPSENFQRHAEIGDVALGKRTALADQVASGNTQRSGETVKAEEVETPAEETEQAEDDIIEILKKNPGPLTNFMLAMIMIMQRLGALGEILLGPTAFFNKVKEKKDEKFEKGDLDKLQNEAEKTFTRDELDKLFNEKISNSEQASCKYVCQRLNIEEIDSPISLAARFYNSKHYISTNEFFELKSRKKMRKGTVMMFKMDQKEEFGGSVKSGGTMITAVATGKDCIFEYFDKETGTVKEVDFKDEGMINFSSFQGMFVPGFLPVGATEDAEDWGSLKVTESLIAEIHTDDFKELNTQVAAVIGYLQTSISTKAEGREGEARFKADIDYVKTQMRNINGKCLEITMTLFLKLNERYPVELRNKVWIAVSEFLQVIFEANLELAEADPNDENPLDLSGLVLVLKEQKIGKGKIKRDGKEVEESDIKIYDKIPESISGQIKALKEEFSTKTPREQQEIQDRITVLEKLEEYVKDGEFKKQ